jgi:hypothetical protein
VYVILIILVGLCAYMLGRESVPPAAQQSNNNQAAIIFTQPLAIDAIAGTPVVSSKNGTRYHRLDCPGANTIKDSNKIYFDSIELAKSAGYLPAGNCNW